jgi:Cro/C1-type HTH DNA-binding domain
MSGGPAAGRRGESEYAAENRRRRAEWEPGYRERLERLIGVRGGPGKVARDAGMSRQTLAKLRKGGMRLSLFATLCLATGVSPKWLLTGRGEMWIAKASWRSP